MPRPCRRDAAPTPPTSTTTCRLVEAQPKFLDLEHVQEVLQELGRLMPGTDVAALLLRDPSWLTRVERGQKRLGQHPD